jgi:hypothetical protein
MACNPSPSHLPWGTDQDETFQNQHRVYHSTDDVFFTCFEPCIVPEGCQDIIEDIIDLNRKDGTEYRIARQLRTCRTKESAKRLADILRLAVPVWAKLCGELDCDKTTGVGITDSDNSVWLYYDGTADVSVKYETTVTYQKSTTNDDVLQTVEQIEKWENDRPQFIDLNKLSNKPNQ